MDLVEVQPREGEHTLRTEDIIAKINELGDELALVCFGGVNFYTGQAFDMAAITQAAHAVGAIGWLRSGTRRR
jgi:kynureninase